MALSLAWTDPATQVSAPVAYAKIISIHVDAVYETVNLEVGIYANGFAQQTGAPPFSRFHGWPDYASLLGQTIDVRAAAYTYLKSLTEFSGAVDV